MSNAKVKPYAINLNGKPYSLQEMLELGGRIKNGLSGRYADFKIHGKDYPKLGEYEIYAMTENNKDLSSDIKINGTLKLLDDKSIKLDFGGSEFSQKGTPARNELRLHIVNALRAAKQGQEAHAEII